MNLEKIKELEDIRKESSKLGEQYSNLFKQKKNRYVINAHDDFKTFFKEKGFNIRENDYEIEAMYGQAKIKMKKANLEENYIGAYSVWEIECFIDKSKYRVLLNKLNHYPTIKTSISTYKKLTEEEKLNKEIQEAKENLENTKKRISEFDAVKFGYGVICEGDRISDNKYPQFESMEELLGSIFK